MSLTNFRCAKEVILLIIMEQEESLYMGLNSQMKTLH